MTLVATGDGVTVRTPAGSVELSAGDDVPADALPGQVESLINLGLVDHVSGIPDAPSPAPGVPKVT